MLMGCEAELHSRRDARDSKIRLIHARSNVRTPRYCPNEMLTKFEGILEMTEPQKNGAAN
jgi:hypothetical protein